MNLDLGETFEVSVCRAWKGLHTRRTETKDSQFCNTRLRSALHIGTISMIGTDFVVGEFGIGSGDARKVPLTSFYEHRQMIVELSIALTGWDILGHLGTSYNDFACV